jgi:glycerophosphoryl diester phosphodiesterase
VSNVTSSPFVYAHRGAHGNGIPENTIAAYEQAAALGAGAIELDVRRSGDDQLVVFHNPKIRRRPLDTLNATEISARAGFDVPTLSEVLSWAGDRIVLDVELKEDGYVERIVATLEPFAATGGRLLVTSFQDSVVAKLGELDATMPRGLLVGVTAIGAVARARTCGATAIVIQARLASRRLLDEAGAAGLRILIWDVLEARPRHARFLRDPRIEAVITDDVAWALAAREQGAQ